MKSYTLFSKLLILVSLAVNPVWASQTDKDPVIAAMQTELSRNLKELHINNLPAPFYADFQISDLDVMLIKATRGALISSNTNQYRVGIPGILVGNYKVNNQNIGGNYYANRNNLIDVPFGTNEEIIRTAMWKVLDGKYKAAVEQFSNKLSAINQMVIPEEERNIPDFQRVEPSEQILPLTPLKCDQKAIEKYITKASEVLKNYKELNSSQVSLSAINSDIRYCNSEGTICRYPNNIIAIAIYINSRTNDGQELTQNKLLTYNSLDELPSLSSLESICQNEAELMKKKLESKMIKESYVGPVLFEGEAVADLVVSNFIQTNGILSQRRAISPNNLQLTNGNELENMVGKKVISRDLTLTSLSGTPTYNGQKLFGYYEIDAQGIKPDKELVLIENGVLRNMLTDRTPSRLFRESNGHARATIDGTNVSLAPGVIRLSSKVSATDSEIKQKLIAAAKEEDYDYAYIVRRLTGNVPSELIRINVKDGTEEMIRGAIVKNMNLRSFKRISAVSGQESLFNRIVNNAKSTFIVPSALLFDEVEVMKDNDLALKKSYVLEKPL